MTGQRYRRMKEKEWQGGGRGCENLEIMFPVSVPNGGLVLRLEAGSKGNTEIDSLSPTLSKTPDLLVS